MNKTMCQRGHNILLKHPWVTGHSLSLIGSWVGVACYACSTGLYSSCTSTGELAIKNAYEKVRNTR